MMAQKVSGGVGSSPADLAMFFNDMQDCVSDTSCYSFSSILFGESGLDQSFSCDAVVAVPVVAVLSVCQKCVFVNCFSENLVWTSFTVLNDIQGYVCV